MTAKRKNKKKNGKSPSVDQREVENFSALAETWWDPHGPFKPLHQLNPTRLEYIRDRIGKNFKRDISAEKPFKGLKILDIGCGGGLLCEPLRRLGAGVTGIDASEKNIKVAELHAKKMKLDIRYLHTSAEELGKKQEKFDVVLNMEVVEHVANVESFLEASRKLVKDRGMMLFSTISRTPKAFALAIVGAEYILNWLPRGTHQFRKFLKPSELARHLQAAGFEVRDLTGFKYDPLGDKWELKDDLSVNYAGVAVPKTKKKS